MKKVLIGILAGLGLLSILAVAAFVVLSLISFASKPRVPSKVILEINLEGEVIEVIPEDPFAELLLEDTLQVRDIVEALEKGAADKRVKGVVARIGGSGIAMAHIQEIRDAIAKFRESGKPTVAFSETFGEFGPGNGGYYLATAFDRIYMQPTGDIGLTGLILESMFLRGALDKLEVVPRLDHRHEYKNAMNFYTERGFTPAHREALQRVMDSWFEQMLDGIAEARGMTVEEARALMDRGPFLGQEALDAGLVDGLGYRDEVWDQLIEEADTDRFLYINRYLNRAGRVHTRGETVALIHGYGAVTRGASSYSPMSGSATMGADTVASAFRAAIEDKRVKAILFRVDSPGGSFVGSDTIWRETIRAQEAGKPVIVSMGHLAGSGGYYVAMNADKIVAQPGTITASIGVLGGKLITSAFWNRLGISFDEVHTSTNSNQWSSISDYTPTGHERFQASLDRIYEVFTSKVAEGRKIPLEEVQEVAKGRIWTGADAKDLGLVDELGGYPVALRLVREAIGVEEDAGIRIKRFPQRHSPFEVFLRRGPDHSAAWVKAFAKTLARFQPAAQVIEEVVATEPGILTMPFASALE